jgi:hypothetical protein
METKDIIEYANRNWEQVSEMDYEYWKTAYKDEGFKATQNASFALWQHLKSIRPEWPNSQERHRDMEHHIKLSKLLEKASHGLSIL